jgi:hypothetical protein
MFAASASAQVTGKVKVDCEAPVPQQINMGADPECAAAHPNPVLDESVVVGVAGELANVVVSIKAPEGKELPKGEKPKDPVVIDKKGCQYVPHVVGMMVGQDLVVKNRDDLLHNVHSLAIDNEPFNFGQPRVDQKGVNKGKAIIISITFSIVSAIFNLFAMRRNALLVKDARAQSLGQDLILLPKIVAEFMFYPIVWLWRRNKKDVSPAPPSPDLAERES